MRQPHLVRERTEDLERASLSTWATLSTESKGRDRDERPDPLRTTFQRDRDALLATTALTKLAGQSAGLAAGRNRLDVTLALVAAARLLARSLRLNEDLTEAIALGCQLGHGPFGEACALALEPVQPHFRPCEQALRTVERLTNDGQGLNLTWEVRDGILNAWWSAGDPATPEGQVVRIACQLIVPDTANWAHLPGSVAAVLGRTQDQVLGAVAADLLTTSLDRPGVACSLPVAAALADLSKAAARQAETSAQVVARRDRALHCLRSLVVYHLQNPSLLATTSTSDASDEAGVIDLVTGLTDDQARRLFVELFTPAPAV